MPRLKGKGTRQTPKKCVKATAYPCGFTCINREDTCRKILRNQAATFLEWLAIQENRLSAINAKRAAKGKTTFSLSDDKLRLTRNTKTAIADKGSETPSEFDPREELERLTRLTAKLAKERDPITHEASEEYYSAIREFQRVREIVESLNEERSRSRRNSPEFKKAQEDAEQESAREWKRLYGPMHSTTTYERIVNRIGRQPSMLTDNRGGYWGDLTSPSAEAMKPTAAKMFAHAVKGGVIQAVGSKGDDYQFTYRKKEGIAKSHIELRNLATGEVKKVPMTQKAFRDYLSRLDDVSPANARLVDGFSDQPTVNLKPKEGDRPVESKPENSDRPVELDQDERVKNLKIFPSTKAVIQSLINQGISRFVFDSIIKHSAGNYEGGGSQISVDLSVNSSRLNKKTINELTSALNPYMATIPPIIKADGDTLSIIYRNTETSYSNAMDKMKDVRDRLEAMGVNVAHLHDIKSDSVVSKNSDRPVESKPENSDRPVESKPMTFEDKIDTWDTYTESVRKTMKGKRGNTGFTDSRGKPFPATVYGDYALSSGGYNNWQVNSGGFRIQGLTKDQGLVLIHSLNEISGKKSFDQMVEDSGLSQADFWTKQWEPAVSALTEAVRNRDADKIKAIVKSYSKASSGGDRASTSPKYVHGRIRTGSQRPERIRDKIKDLSGLESASGQLYEDNGHYDNFTFENTPENIAKFKAAGGTIRRDQSAAIKRQEREKLDDSYSPSGDRASDVFTELGKKNDKMRVIGQVLSQAIFPDLATKAKLELIKKDRTEAEKLMNLIQSMIDESTGTAKEIYNYSAAGVKRALEHQLFGVKDPTKASPSVVASPVPDNQGDLFNPPKPKDNPVTFQTQPLSARDQAIAKAIRKEEQRAKSGKGFTDTAKAYIAEALLAQKDSLAQPTKPLIFNGFKITGTPLSLIDEAARFLKEGDHSKMARIFKKASAPRPVSPDYAREKAKNSAIDLLKRVGFLYGRGRGSYYPTIEGSNFLENHTPFESVASKGKEFISINLPGATEFNVKNTPEAIENFLKGVGIKPDELQKWAERLKTLSFAERRGITRFEVLKLKGLARHINYYFEPSQRGNTGRKFGLVC